MKPANQVIEVLAWRTNDGQLFNGVQEANAHAASISFLNWYRHGNAIHGAETGDRVDERDMAQWLQETRAAILEFLAATKGE